MWRAAYHLCDYVYHHPDKFRGKTVCELGSGLGMVSILLDKLKIAEIVYATDGDDNTMDLLIKNIEKADSQVIAKKLWWGAEEDMNEILKCMKNVKFDFIMAADVIYEESQISACDTCGV